MCICCCSIFLTLSNTLPYWLSSASSSVFIGCCGIFRLSVPFPSNSRKFTTSRSHTFKVIHFQRTSKFFLPCFVKLAGAPKCVGFPRSACLPAFLRPEGNTKSEREPWRRHGFGSCQAICKRWQSLHTCACASSTLSMATTLYTLAFKIFISSWDFFRWPHLQSVFNYIIHINIKVFSPFKIGIWAFSSFC